MRLINNNNRTTISIKKIHFQLILVFTCIISINFISCKNKNSADSNKENAITFDTIYTNKAYYIDNDSTQPSCNLKFTFIYPKVYTNKMVLDTLQQIFISSFIGEGYQYDEPKAALTKYEKDYIDAYKHDIEVFYGNRDNDHENEDKYLSYYETIANKIIFNKANILSFQVSRTNYKGGANTYQYYSNYSTDLSTGEMITEDEIFKPEYVEVLSSLFKEKIMEENKVKNISELNNLGYFGIEEIAPNGNFLIQQDGITYTFNTGEYSAYKLDPIVIKISYKELNPILKEDSPIQQLIDNQL